MCRIVDTGDAQKTQPAGNGDGFKLPTHGTLAIDDGDWSQRNNRLEPHAVGFYSAIRSNGRHRSLARRPFPESLLVREQLMTSRLFIIPMILAATATVSASASATTTASRSPDAQAQAAALLSGAKTSSTSETQMAASSSSAAGDAHKHAAALLSGARAVSASSADLSPASDSARARGSEDAQSHAASLLVHGGTRAGR